MSDPAVEAADRLGMFWEFDKKAAEKGAREALNPVRTWFEWWNGVESGPLPPQAWGELARLLYTTEELS